MIKWTKKDVIAAFQAAIMPQQKAGNNQLLQQLLTIARTKRR